MTLWEKIKCYFGNCPEEITKEQEQEALKTYKAEPKTYKVTPKAKAKMDEIIAEVKLEETKKVSSAGTSVKKSSGIKAKLKPVSETKSANGIKVIKVAKTITKKPKRSWYNNQKTQKLVTIEEAEKLPKTWIKGKIPRKHKGDK